MVQQLKLLKGAVDTLTEFVQGPNETNQLAVIQADLLKRLQPIFELASCMNLSGVVLTEDPGRTPERWTGGEVMLSVRAQFRAITVLQKQYAAEETLADTATQIDHFIQLFPAATRDSMRSEVTTSINDAREADSSSCMPCWGTGLPEADRSSIRAGTKKSDDKRAEEWCTNYLNSATQLVEVVDELEKSAVRLILGLMEGHPGDGEAMPQILRAVQPKTLVTNLDLHSQRLQLLKGVDITSVDAQTSALAQGFRMLRSHMGLVDASLLPESDLSASKWLER
eukprot:529529-Prymnesium_polylepis.1